MQVCHGFSLLTVHNVDLDKWCDRYELEVFSHPCHECGQLLTVDIPFIADDRRGLTAGCCDCGNQQTPFTYVNLSFDRINLNSLCVSAESSMHAAYQERSETTAPTLRLIDMSGD